MLCVSHVAEAAEQLLHQEQGNLLQDGLLQVGCGRWASNVAAGRPPARGGRLCDALSLAPEPPCPECSGAPRGPSPPALSAMNQELQAERGCQHRFGPLIASGCCGPLGFGRVSGSVSDPARVSGSSSDFQRVGRALMSPSCPDPLVSQPTWLHLRCTPALGSNPTPTPAKPASLPGRTLSWAPDSCPGSGLGFYPGRVRGWIRVWSGPKH